MAEERYLALIQTDPRSTDELIELLFLTDEKQVYDYTLRVLHFRGTREVLDKAHELCKSSVPMARKIGVEILDRLGESVRLLDVAREKMNEYPSKQSVYDQLVTTAKNARQFPEEVIPILLHLLSVEDNTDVIESIAFALGQYSRINHAVISALVGLAEHNSSQVRIGVAASLGYIDDPTAIATMIMLSADQDSTVRFPATLALSQGLWLENIDCTEIREALYARVHDEDELTRCSALRGLMSRGDARIIDLLLIQPYNTVMLIDFAEALIKAGITFGDPRLLSSLLWLRRHGCSSDGSFPPHMPNYDRLLKAINNCLSNALSK